MDAIERLLAVEEIKKLKARYFKHLDFKEWDALAGLFTPDACIDYRGHARDLAENHGRSGMEPSPENWVFTGGRAVTAFLSPLLVDVISVHHGHDPQISVLDSDSATGFWALYDRLESAGDVFHGYGHYHERYRRVAGTWLISELVLTRRRSAIEPKYADFLLHLAHGGLV